MKLKTESKSNKKNGISAQKVMLHIGCGTEYMKDWINIGSVKESNKSDFDWDLTKPLPFKNNSVDLIFDKHFFDKMELGEAVIESALWNYRCMLKPDGIFKIAIPFTSVKEKLEPWLNSLGFPYVEFYDPASEYLVSFDNLDLDIESKLDINDENLELQIDSKLGTSNGSSFVTEPIATNTTDTKTKLHVGCGTVYIDGWVNIDNNSDHNITKLDLNFDLRNPLPYKDNSVDFIYNEHFFEHLSVEEGLNALLNFKRVLKPGGVMRIAMPDLLDIVKMYNNDNWKTEYAETFKEHGMEFIKTKAELININFRWWGHKWMYDWEELERRLREVGFTQIKQCELRKSDYPELCGLESRSESTLIAEVTKTKEKIPCFIVVFFDFETVKKSLDFITKYSDRLDITIIENHSDYTKSHIKPYILDLIKEGKVNNYYLFDENIGANAGETVIKINAANIKMHPYFIISDGDLVIDDENWLNEQIEIIENNPEVFATGVELDLSNLPVAAAPDAVHWVPKALDLPNKTYKEGPTGGWFLLSRSDDFLNIIRTMHQTGEKLVDSNLFKYCYSQLNKKWARTKKCIAKHLTWDLYATPDHPYNKWKLSQPLIDLWHHDRYCGFTLINKDSSKHYTCDKATIDQITNMMP